LQPEDMKKRSVFSDTPTQLSYHRIPLTVNKEMVIITTICEIYEGKIVTLYNIPSCKMKNSEVLYSYKEVIPMI